LKIIFQVNGGIGKCVAATAVCKAIKTQYPDDQLIVVTPYPAIFLCNPNVDKILTGHDLAYFYQEHIQDQKIKTLLHDPYLETDFINTTEHLTKIWCEMFGIKHNDELPEIFLTNREQTSFARQFASQKPILVLQTNGGPDNQPNKYSWMRDMPMATAQTIVDVFASEYNILHFRRDDQLPLRNVTPVRADFRTLAALILLSEKRLFIDSFAQHTAAALGKPSVVCWIGNDPKQFGYKMHTNIIANPPTIKPELRQSVYRKYNASGLVIEYPYSCDSEIFDVDAIVQAIVNEPEEVPGIGKTSNNLIIKEKIRLENKKGSMVGKRLNYLVGQTDLSNIKRVLDIGSWHLRQSIEFSNVFKNAKIDAFEPVPESYQFCLNRHVGLEEQKKSRIEVHNLALSNSEGEIPFYPVDPNLSSTPNVGASSMFKFIEGLNGSPFNQNLVQNEILVRANTLDNWCKENNVSAVDIMWVDVQGSELLVFQGAENILKNTRIIMTEVGLKPYYQGHTLKQDIDAFLFERGFIELEGSFEESVVGYEANTIYVKN